MTSSAAADKTTGLGSDDRSFSHLSHDFLQPDKIRDGQKRRPTDPDYDPRTLFVPDSFMTKQTPVSDAEKRKIYIPLQCTSSFMLIAFCISFTINHFFKPRKDNNKKIKVIECIGYLRLFLYGTLA